MSNIWTAASEGNFERVKELVESGLSPSVPDENTYTPLHAAASWNHIDILRYLVQQGGDVNVTDDDGETPLFVVETAEMARVLVELGADVRHTNLEGVTAAESLEEDQPHVSLYLRTLTGESTPAPSTASALSSASVPNPDLDQPTDLLLSRVRTVMEASERGELTPEETDTRLREIVESAVEGQVAVGRGIGEAMETDQGTSGVREREDANGDRIQAHGEKLEDGSAVKRRREDPGR
ncbi:ankyrin [Meredithblackwellia eburnea MCA 4105]